MNGNEVLKFFKQKGFHEKSVTEMFLRIAEEQRDIKRDMNEMAKVFEQLVQVQTMLNGVADGLKAKLEANERKDDDASSTRGMLG